MSYRYQYWTENCHRICDTTIDSLVLDRNMELAAMRNAIQQRAIEKAGRVKAGLPPKDSLNKELSTLLAKLTPAQLKELLS